MSQRRGRWLTPILFAFVGGFVLLFFFLLTAFSGGGSIGMTLANGRNVTVQSDSWYISSESDGNNCTTRTAGRTIIIASDAVSVDGQQLASIPPETKDVNVSVDNGQITFVADGATIATCPR